MDWFRIYFTLFCIAFGEIFLHAQTITDSTSEVAQFDCKIIQNKEKLQNKNFISTPDLRLRANNEELVYAVMKLGKRGHDIFMYIRIIDENVCIKKDQVLEIQYTNGEKVSYKNDHSVNCDGIFVRKFDQKEIKKISENEMTAIKIYTYQKNYEFLVSSTLNYDINNQIHCLAAYKMKST
ncbi:hypothetical protein J2795_002085 [Chryseobacterium bernardetii]|jgi:hypothetical protein|uniref:Uncharacterized protein n=1 Tax=Chryseobacterium bernardetii TaxID=1241978 RepID=A0ACC6IUC7_9FLAO|nr:MULTISPECIES: hypothetical protein [Chryseobacterium]MDR6370869.1 hypothetical protein [Chryseobacterium vietnamense]MDR6441385.1 hypothetical protein [Chryseobacterium bernardetii]